MKAQTHVRLASLAAGDDVTLTRYVRINRGVDHAPRHHQPRIPGLALAFADQGRTKFPTRVIAPDEMTTLLVSGHSNVKIGRDVRKGRFRGYWIYTLSLEERKTCPSSCQHWQDCYGNNMPFAKRVDHIHPEFLPRLERDIVNVLGMRSRRGVLIRLHALGDFYSPQYVDFWRLMLKRHENLAVYGYTARNPLTDPIGVAIQAVADRYGDRFMVRHSDGGWPEMSTVSILSQEAVPAGAFVCPEQTGQTRCCATCGACWGTKKNVAFLAH